jgi:hypothetical protein
VGRTATYDAVLNAEERVDERPFTDPAATEADASVMRRMLERERALVRSWGSDHPPTASIRGLDSQGRRHWLAVPDTAALLTAHDITAVGFFGQTRDCDHTLLFELEDEVVEHFPEYAAAGLLSYFDRELEDGSHGFGNLILFATPDVPPEWYTNRAHEQAVSISPEHYHSIRLHKGTAPGPFLGDGELRIERTKYFDFAMQPTWRGLRVFGADD